MNTEKELDHFTDDISYSVDNNNDNLRMWFWVNSTDGQPLPYNILNITSQNNIMKIECDLMTCDLPREKNKILNYELPIRSNSHSNPNFSLFKSTIFKSVNHYDLYYREKL